MKCILATSSADRKIVLCSTIGGLGPRVRHQGRAILIQPLTIEGMRGDPMSGATVVTSETVSDAVSRMGLAGHAVMVHSSLSSFGWVESGAQTVIDGILGQECTIMVPTFSRAYELLPRQDERIPRNGKEYEGGLELPPGSDPIYAPDSNVVNPSMGTIPATVLAMSGRARSVHARQSFTAVGPLADELTAGQTVEDVFAPIRNLGRMQGFVVLAGVGLTSMTALHFAEEMAGRRPFRRWAYGTDGSRKPFAIAGCSGGFDNLATVLSPIERHTLVGRSLWRVFPAADALDRASEAIRAEQSITHCDKEVCLDCEDAIAGGPVIVGTP